MNRFAVLVVVTLVLGVAGPPGVGLVPAAAQTTEGSAQITASVLCDSGETVQFDDVEGSDYGAAYILCMRALGLSQGSKDGSYGPDGSLTRGQMASFLVRLWIEQLDRECPSGVEPSGADVPFTDIKGNTHEANIKCLFSLGIAKGTSPTVYGPQDRLIASQITRFLQRMYQKAGGERCESVDGLKLDNGSELDRAAECLVSLKVIPTAAEATSSAAVTRAQMGVYVVGLWYNLAGKGIPPVPPQLNATTPMTSTVKTRTVNTTTFTAISVGWWHSCGLREGGTAVCWGFNGYGGVNAPLGKFSVISAGYEHSCGLRTDGIAVCWGNNYYGQADSPDGKSSAISAAGGSHSCGLRTDGIAVCWGHSSDGDADASGEFTAISAGWWHSCGLREDGTVVCWGNNSYGQADPPEGEFVSVSAGDSHSCGLSAYGAVVCWGRDSYGQADPPSGKFSAVSAGLEYSCGLREDGTVVCWGNNSYGQADPPEGEFSFVSAGGGHSCGLRTDGTVVCWGRDSYGQVDDLTAGQFSAVSAGLEHSCGLREDGTAVCWRYVLS